ncbi:MAG: tetratricopeptide repeat protein [Chitinispirillaceae bacterium]|nr:tetratricopeptide repeat protein [Chitinispirillaceae bacterium]
MRLSVLLIFISLAAQTGFARIGTNAVSAEKNGRAHSAMNPEVSRGDTPSSGNDEQKTVPIEENSMVDGNRFEMVLALDDSKASDKVVAKEAGKVVPATQTTDAEKPAKGKGPVSFIFGRAINTAPNAEERWLPAVIEAILEFKLAAIDEFRMVSPDTIGRRLPAHRDFRTVPEGEDYLSLGKKLGADYVGIQKFEVGRDKSVFYYMEIMSVSQKTLVSTVERTFKLKKLGTELDEIINLILKEFNITPKRELARFMKIPAIDEDLRGARAFGECIVAERFSKTTDSMQLGIDYRTICERQRNFLAAYYRAGFFFMAIGKYADAAEAFNLLFLSVPEYLPVYVPLAHAFRKSQRFEDAIRIALLGDKRGILLSELTQEKALSYLDMGKQKEAQEAYRQVLQKNPDDPYALLFYSKFYNDTENPKAALEFADRLLKANEHIGNASLEKGRALVKLKRTQEAVTALTKATELLPGEIEPVIYLGDAQASVGEYDQALAMYEQVLPKAGDNVNLYLRAAAAAEKSGKRKKAIELLKGIESRFSNHPDLQRELGLLELAEGDSARARVHLEAGLRSKTEDERVLTGLGWIYVNSGQYDKAATMFNKALPLVKDKNQCKVGLAMVYIKKGDTKKAAVLIEEVSAAKLSIPGINGMLGDAMAAKGEKKSALVYYRKERALGTKEKVLQKKIADLSYELEYAKTARSEYEQFIKMGGGGGTIFYRMVTLSLKLKDAGGAKEYMEKAVKAGDTDAATWMEIGNGYSTLGLRTQALDAFTRCVSKDSKNEEAWSAIVALNTKIGNDSAAAEADLRLYDINPDKYQKSLATAGRLFEKKGLKTKAKNAFALFIKNKHIDADVNIRLAIMMYEEKNYSAVISLLDSVPALTLGIKNGKMLVQAYFAVKKYDKTIPLLDYILSRSPKDLEALEWAALANEYAKQIDDAIKWYRKYLLYAGKNKKYAYHLAELLESTGDKKAAVAQYRTNVKLYPTDERNYKKLATLYMEQKAWKSAIVMLEKSLTFDNASPSVMGQLARANLELGRKKEAMDYLQTYIRNAPNDSLAWYELGMLYYHDKQYSNAAKTLQKAIGLMRKPTAEHYRMIGVSLLASADTASAIGFLEKARSADKNQKEILSMLVTCYRSTGNTRLLSGALSDMFRMEPDNDTVRMELAELYLSEGKSGEGIKLLENALQKRECDVPLHLKLVSLYERQGDKKKWLLHLQTASKCDPKNVDMLFQIGRYYHGENNRLQAERYLKKALRLDKRFAPANGLLGTIMLDRKEYKGAAVFLSRAVAMDRGNDTLRTGLSEAFYHLGRYEDAYKVIRRVVQKGEIQPGALRLVGLIYKAMGNPDTAKQILENAIQIDRNCSECLIALGDLYFDEADYSNAMDRYKRAFDQAGYSRNAAMRLAQSYMRVGKPDQALELYERVIAEDPGDGEAAYRVVNIYLSKDEFSKAMAVRSKGGYNKNGWYFLSDAEIREKENNINAAMLSYAKALKMIPEVPEVQAGCGRISLVKRKYAAAIKYFGQAMAGDPENVDLLFGMGQAYEGNGDRNTALDLYTEVARQNPQHPEVHYAMARIYSKAKDHDMAIRELEKGGQIDRKNPMFFFALGHEYRIIGNTSKAIENYTRALRIDEKKMVEAYRYIGNIYYKSGNEKKAKKNYALYIKLGGKNKRVIRYMNRTN